MVDDATKNFLESLLEASETVLQEEHPNPNRIGCPDQTALDQLANFPEKNLTVEADVIRHISECYPCFRELREMRLMGKPTN